MHELSSSSLSLLLYSSNLRKFSWLTFVPAERCLNSTTGIQVRHPLSHFNFITYLSLKSYDSWGQRQIYGCKVKEKNRIDLKTAFRKGLEREIGRNSESFKEGKIYWKWREINISSREGTSWSLDNLKYWYKRQSSLSQSLWLWENSWIISWPPLLRWESGGQNPGGRAVPRRQAWTIKPPPGWSTIFPILWGLFKPHAEDDDAQVKWTWIPAWLYGAESPAPPAILL